MIDKIMLIVGLGNPGKEYALTYHNVGQQFLHFLSSEEEGSKKQPLFTTNELKTEKEGKSIYLVKPKTFMNESGIAVKAALKYFHVPISSLIVAHDDFDLPLGTWRASQNRGSAGHHGVDSIIKELKTKDFLRIRIGVRTSKEKAGEVALRRMSVKDKKILQSVFQEAKEKVIEKTYP